MSEKITLALVGRGAWGQNYIRTISRISEALLPSHYIKTRNYKELLDKKDIDGVIIATPAPTHFEIAKEFVKRGFNLLVEKPITTSYREALELRAIQKKTESEVMVGHIYLYHPAFIEFKKRVKKIGKIYYIESSGMDFGPLRTDVSALWDWAPHDISMIVDLLGKIPTSVAAWGVSPYSKKKNHYDMCMIKLNFIDTSSFTTIGWLSPIKKRKMTIVGEKGAIIFDDLENSKITFIQNTNSTKKISYPSYPLASPLKIEILEFIDCIKNKRKPKTDLEQGALIVKIIETAEKSIKSNGKELKFTL